MRTGVYFCQVDDQTQTDIDAIAKYSANLPEVETVQNLGVKPKISIKNLTENLRSNNLERVVIAGDMPGYYKPAFTKAIALAGGNTSEVRLASFQEHGIQNGSSLDRAKAIVACATYGVPFSLAAVPGGNPVNHATLVIGAGIAGIQASLEIANAGKQVYLVEQSGTIGGHMAMFDKTFPTLDCAACILTPKMVDVGQHEMINLMTMSKVVSLRGKPGSYKVKIKMKARRVDINACVACENV